MTTINSTVTVVDAGSVSSTPDPLIVTAVNTDLVFTLDDDSAIYWKLIGLTSNDQRQQLGPVAITKQGKSLSVIDYNTVQESFNITLLVQHRSTGERVDIDPAVQNDPQL